MEQQFNRISVSIYTGSPLRLLKGEFEPSPLESRTLKQDVQCIKLYRGI